jgi:iodotyrosine deiodinase
LFPVGYAAADAEVPDLQRKTLAEVTVEIPAPSPRSLQS